MNGYRTDRTQRGTRWIAALLISLLLCGLTVFPGKGLAAPGMDDCHTVTLDFPTGGVFSAAVFPDTAQVNQRGQWSLWLTVDSFGLEAGSKVWIALPRAFRTLQTANPAGEGYVSLSSPSSPGSVMLERLESNQELLLPFWPFDKKLDVVEISISGAGLVVGDVLVLSIGGAAPGARAKILDSSRNDPFLMAWQRQGGEEVVGASRAASLLVQPAPGKVPVAFLPSVSQVDREARLQVMLYDRWFNRAVHGTVHFTVACTDPNADWPSALSLSPADSGRLETMVRFRSPGVHYLIFQPESVDPEEEWPLAFRSNPVRVVAEPAPALFWGEFHSHSAHSYDASGEVSFRKARLANCLDFFCATEHHRGGSRSAGISCEEWETTMQEALREHRPGSFVPFLGYETSFNGDKGGHHNQIFAFADERIADVPVYVEAQTMQDVWEGLAADVPGNYPEAIESGLAVLSIPHHTGKNFDTGQEGRKATVSFGPDAGPSAWRRVIEIYSNHGQSERYAPDDPLSYEKNGDHFGSVDGPHYAQDAWALGDRMGVIACSDDHSGRGGSPLKGVFAVRSDSLERWQLFSNIAQRHTYGTTGDRMLLEFSINGASMGDVLNVSSTEALSLKILAAGTEPLQAVWLLRWDFTDGQMRNGHPAFDTVARYEPAAFVFSDSFTIDLPRDSALYYLKVQQSSRLQSNGIAQGWSSPIWVFRESATETVVLPFRVYPNPASDHLFLYVPEGLTPKTLIQVFDASGAFVDGQLLRPEDASTLKLDLRDYPPGWYWVQLPKLGLASTFLKLP